jgi:signal peptidase II
MSRTGDLASPKTETGRVGSPPTTRLRLAVAVVALVIAAADQISKSVVLATNAGTSGRPGTGWVSIQLARNHGVSTGIGANHPLIVTCVEMLGVIVVGVLAFRTRNRVVAIALALVLGGALGNAADRFVRAPGLGRGAVVDWIHLGGRGGSLDLADVAIQSGAILAIAGTLIGIWAETRRRRVVAAPE